jgi:hypothetical protein
MARELAHVLNPTLRPSALIPVLCAILAAGDPRKADAILDGFEYARTARATDAIVEAPPPTEIRLPTFVPEPRADAADGDEVDRAPTSPDAPDGAPDLGMATTGLTGPASDDTGAGPSEPEQHTGEDVRNGGGDRDAGSEKAPEFQPPLDLGGAPSWSPRGSRQTEQGGGRTEHSNGVGSGTSAHGHQPRSGAASENQMCPTDGDDLTAASGGITVSPGTDNPDRAGGEVAGLEDGSDRARRPSHAAIPRFDGERRPRVPSIPTDWDALRRRYGVTRSATSMEELAKAFDDNVDRQLRQGQTNGGTTIGDRPTTVRLTLSGQGRRQGFLPLTRAARAMLDSSVQELECRIDDGDGFPLYVDWHEGILFNQTVLPELFDAKGLPAGAILTLERQPSRVYRLGWNLVATVLHDVRIAELQPDGSVKYEVIRELELPCEVDDLVARADKRLEDPEALFAEAVGKKSVFETLCDLFDEAEDNRLHQDDLFHRVSMIRMVSYYSIMMVLQERPCFVGEDNGWWRFDPALGLKAPRRVDRAVGQAGVSSILSGSSAAIETVPAQPSSLAELAQILDRLAGVAEMLGAPTTPDHGDTGLDDFWGAFDRLVRVVEGRHWRSRPVPASLAPGEGTRSILDRGTLEGALGYLNDVQNGAMSPEVEARLAELTRALVDSPSDLRTFLARANDETLHALLLPTVLEAFQLHVQTEDLDAARELLVVLEQRIGACSAERMLVEAAHEALELAELAELDTDPGEQIAGLRAALTVNPDSATIRRCLTLAVERHVEPLATMAADHGTVHRWPQAALTLAEAADRWAAQADVVQPGCAVGAQIARVGRLLIDELEPVVSKVDPHGGGVDLTVALAGLWEAVARTSTPLSGRDAGRARWALHALGVAYAETGEPIRATLALGRLVQQLRHDGQRERHGEITRDLFERLGALYDELCLWDLSRPIWRSLQDHVPGEEKRRIAARASFALNEQDRKPLALRAAWRQFGIEIDALSGEPDFVLAVSGEYLDRITEKVRRCLQDD